MVALACAINPVTNRPQFVLTSRGQERALGERASREVERTFGFLEDPAIGAYVSQVGDRVAAETPESGFSYQFRVVEMDEPNAFALPGGYVFVSRGLLALTNSEAELAGILGHEIGHVAARHGTNQASVQAPMRIATGLGALATGFVSRSLGELVAGAGDRATEALFASYGREQEREADELGQRFMVAAGYDPAGLPEALDTLHRHAVLQGEDGRPGFFSSHPSTPERVAATRARAAAVPPASRVVPSPRAAHLHAIDGLRTGPDPAQGVFVGETFVQPELGFAIRFPPGWERSNARDFVAARTDSALLLVSLAGKGNDPMTVARAVTREDAFDGALRVGTIGTLPAVRTEVDARVDGRAAKLDLAWVASGGLVYQVLGASVESKDRRAVHVSTNSFRPADASDRAGIRVERLRLRKAAAGETVGAVAARARSRGEPAELEVLNGRPPGARLAAGEWVKILREERYELPRTSGQATHRPSP